MFLKYLIEALSEEINIDITDEYDNDVGSVQGIIHQERQNLLNWLELEKVDNVTYQIIKKIPDNKLLPVAILKNINIYDEYKNQGFGNEGMNQFLDEAIGVSIIILIADMGENQSKGFDLVKWYEKFGFKVIGNSAVSDYPVMILQQ